MRSTIERAFAAPVYLPLRGVKYQCSPLRIGHFAEAKAFLIQLLPDPVKELAADQETFGKFPPEIQKALAIKALEQREENRSLNSNMAAHWVNSVEGILFLFWCMVRDHHKDLATMQAVMERFPPGQNTSDGELSIAECQLIQKTIDATTLGGQADDAKKKKMNIRRSKLKKATRANR